MVTGSIDTSRFPSPLQVWRAAAQIATTGYADATLLGHAVHSLALVAMGFVVAVSVGLPLSAGVTLYVAATDLVPEVNREPGIKMALIVFFGVGSLFLMHQFFHLH